MKKVKIIIFSSFFFANQVFGAEYAKEKDLNDLKERLDDALFRPPSTKDDVNSVIIEMGVPNQIEKLRESVSGIEKLIAGGVVKMDHLIEQLEMDHKLIDKNTDGILLLDNRVLLLEREMPEHDKRLCSLEDRGKRSDESLKKLLISALTSTFGLIGGVVAILIAGIKLFASWRTNKEIKELLRRNAEAQEKRNG